ncbi:radical SAM protein [Magnetococcales bacterium HHB-1]
MLHAPSHFFRKKQITIGLIELPPVELHDTQGKVWTTARRDTPLISKQILMANLAASGVKPVLVNLAHGDYKSSYGEVTWNNKLLSKIFAGANPFDLDPDHYDLWGLTVNFTLQREMACVVIRHLAQGNKPIIVGGSDPIGYPKAYLEAGATAVVLDKSGGANQAVLYAAMGQIPPESVKGAVFSADRPVQRARPMDISDWPLPSKEISQQCFGGHNYREIFPDHLAPIGSIMPDIGCDRTCDFCQTPNYKLGYRAMSVEMTLAWIAQQKDAGARSINIYSDQFLARILKPKGREELLRIAHGARELEMPLQFPNGLEIRKLTRGRGLNRDNTDLRPDTELVEALCGWDGRVGTSYIYIGGERPVAGQEKYAKLLPWRLQSDMLHSMVKAGLPHIAYGVIIGFEDENNESFQNLEEAISDLTEQLLEINPALHFSFEAYALTLAPGTGQERRVRQSGLLRFDDPTLYGGFWTPSIDSHALSYQEISAWQMRLMQLGTPESRKDFLFL